MMYNRNNFIFQWLPIWLKINCKAACTVLGTCVCAALPVDPLKQMAGNVSASRNFLSQAQLRFCQVPLVIWNAHERSWLPCWSKQEAGYTNVFCLCNTLSGTDDTLFCLSGPVSNQLNQQQPFGTGAGVTGELWHCLLSFPTLSAPRVVNGRTWATLLSIVKQPTGTRRKSISSMLLFDMLRVNCTYPDMLPSEPVLWLN